jgi:Holliday junction resolvasome RuvABC endonuclease subunit
MIFVGIDPGASGAVAFLPSNGNPWFVYNKDSLRDLAEEVVTASRDNVVVAMIEIVHSSPQMGVKSAFTFGQSYGRLEAVFIALGIVIERVRPAAWQKAMQCMTKGDKNITKAKAQELFPNTKITHANADALLIAEYSRRNQYLTCGS